MKSNALASLLTGAIIVCALISGWVFLRYFLAVKELQKLQGQYVFMNNTRNAAQSLFVVALAALLLLGMVSCLFIFKQWRMVRAQVEEQRPSVQRMWTDYQNG